MIFDTDVVIFALRGNRRAAELIDRDELPVISVVSYLELARGARDKAELRDVGRFLKHVGLHTLPLSENIGFQARIYIEEYGLKSGLGVADSLIAATAADAQLTLCSGNAKHFRTISDLDLRVFRGA